MASAERRPQARNRSFSRGRARSPVEPLPVQKSRVLERGVPQQRASSVPPKPKGAAKSSARGSSRGPSRRPSSLPPRRPAAPKIVDWGHPEGMPLEEIDENAEMSGVVVTVAEFGVFVDVGAERDALLGCPARYWRRFCPGDRLDGLTLEKVDLEARRFTMHLDDPELVLEKNRKPLHRLTPGSYVEGVVQGKNSYGIFLNIRASNTGRLSIPRAIGIQFFRGMVLKRVRIDDVDVEGDKISLSLDDPEEELKHMSIVSFKKVEPKAKAKLQPKLQPKPTEPKVKAKEKAKVAALPAHSVLPSHGVSVGVRPGNLVDGVVNSIAAKGVMVDVGLEKLCTLVVSADLKKEFQKGDRVQGMMVEKVSAGGNVTLSMEDPELELDEAPAPKPVKAKAKPKAKTKMKPKQ